MDCWIGISQRDRLRVVKVAGRLTFAQVPDLLLACGDVGPLELDLSDLVFVDASGIEAIQRLREFGASFVGTPGYINLKLET